MFLEEGIRDVITCFKFGDDRFRDLASAEGQILPFPIDFDGRPYNTLTLPCECVIDWLSMVLRLRQHNIGYTADGFYRSDDPTNSVKALKDGG